MFSITTQKDIITVQRTLTLKKDGVLPGGILECSASIDTGIDLKSSDGKDLITKFDGLFNGKISGKAKKQDERIKKARDQLAKWVHQGESENKIRLFADTQQEDIVRDWNTFMRVDIKRAAYDAIQDALKKSSIIFDDLKLKFSSVDLKDVDMEFMTGVLNIPGKGGQGRVAKAGMAGLVSGMQDLEKPIGVVRGGWERNVTLLKQATQDAAAVQKNLTAMRKATSGMNARLARMKKIADASNKISAQSSKGVDIVMGALAKHHKIAKLNDQDKIVIIANKAISSFNAAKKDSKDTQVAADTTRLETVLNDIGKLLAEAETLSKASTDSFANATKANSTASSSVKTGEDSVTAALKELRLQFKTK